MTLTAAERKALRELIDRAARARARRAGGKVELDPERFRQCEGIKALFSTGAGERCHLQAKPGSRFCGTHQRAAHRPLTDVRSDPDAPLAARVEASM